MKVLLLLQSQEAWYLNIHQVECSGYCYSELTCARRLPAMSVTVECWFGEGSVRSSCGSTQEIFLVVGGLRIVDPWTTQVWTAWVHLHGGFFNSRKKSMWFANGLIHRCGTLDMSYMWIFSGTGSGPLSPLALLNGQLYFTLLITKPLSASLSFMDKLKWVNRWMTHK